jgi:hypothetical protein
MKSNKSNNKFLGKPAVSKLEKMIALKAMMEHSLPCEVVITAHVESDSCFYTINAPLVEQKVIDAQVQKYVDLLNLHLVTVN